MILIVVGGEQPLLARACCNLGSINLYEFVLNPFTSDAKFDFNEFNKAVKTASHALDHIIDENADRLPVEMAAYKDNALKWRNMGLGVYGYADMLMALRIKYGSQPAIEFTEKLFSKMIQYAIFYNIERAKLYGTYPMFDRDAIRQSEFYQKHIKNHPLLEDGFEQYGFRNCTLLSIAPTGSIATCQMRSGGTEPEFALSYTRRTDNLADEYKIEAAVVKDYRRITGDQSDELPTYFIESGDIPWRARIDTQAVIQEHVDTAISSTVNLPKSTTVEEIEELYLYAWQRGLKGVTIFRDGCKRLGILLTDDSVDDDTTSETTQTGLGRGDIVIADDDVVGKKRKLTTGCGSLHCTAFFDPITGDLCETYLSRGSTGGCANNMTAVSRMISLASRAGVALDDIIDQLNSCGVCPSYAVRRATKHDTSKGSCCPIAVGYALKDMWLEMQHELGLDEMIDEPESRPMQRPPSGCPECDEEVEAILKEFHLSEEEAAKLAEQYEEANVKGKCPECGAELTFTGGCVICTSCAYSKCD